jgi:sialate O-acetylesterase
MKELSRCLLFLFGLFIGSAVNALADVKLPALISDGMVLQQGGRVPLWGWADEGETVTVQFQGQKVSATAEGGKWTLYLKPLRAGGPFTLTVAGKNRIELKNVLVGEVWVASGQSNMQWALRQSENADAEIAAAKYPLIRLFQVPRLEADAPQDDVKAKWQECSPESVAAFSAVAYYFGRELHKRRGVPVGLINSSVGGTPAESWTREAVLNADADFRKLVEAYPQRMEQYQKALEAHRAAVEKAKAEGKPEPRAPGRPWKPAALYNGMIAPLIPYAIKGAIWYQGESNAGRAYQYRSLFPAMIRNWRDDWRQGDFPFLFVQLAPFGPNGDKLGESDWAELREAQLMTLSRVPQTGMAVITDFGVYDDIHPKMKQPVGERLALAARAVAYGEKVVHSGPIYEAMKVDGNKVILSFKHTGGGLEARGGELKGFIVAGEDKVWREAKAEIRGREVVVTSAEVARPVAVRYGWAKFPVVNLYNKEGLPASPFRTDDWPGVTAPQAPTASPTTSDARPSRQLPEGTRVLSDLAYVTNGHERQKLDLYLPAQGTNLPLVIWVHGGAFRGGSKDNPPALRLLGQGYAVASINYRLSQHAVFPTQIEDCKAAVRWLRANARQYGLDANRFGAWGASAGGHLVAMLGTAGEVKAFEVGENLGESSRVQAVVDYFGPTDFLQMDAHRLPDGMVHNLPDSPESQLVGGHIQENKEKVARANPITYVTPGDAPFLVVHGDRDPLVPHHQSVLLDEALKKAGVDVTFYTVKGGGHGGFKDPQVDKLVDDFLAKHLKPALTTKGQ